MIIDAHLHVWSRRFDPKVEIPALALSPTSPARDVTLAEPVQEATDAGVSGFVVVQVANSLQHTDELLDTAAAAPLPTKVVGWLPLTDPDAMQQAIASYRENPLLVGARHRLQDRDSPDLLLSPATMRGLTLLAEAGMVFDVLPSHSGVLDRIPRIGDALPDLTITIGLTGWPHIEAGRMQPWTDLMAAAAENPRVIVKVGGLFRLSDGPPDPRDWQPYVDSVIEMFGADRVMIGSSWPTEARYGRRYTQSISSVLGTFADLTPSERRMVEYGTAARVFGFPPPPDTAHG